MAAIRPVTSLVFFAVALLVVSAAPPVDREQPAQTLPATLARLASRARTAFAIASVRLAASIPEFGTAVESSTSGTKALARKAAPVAPTDVVLPAALRLRCAPSFKDDFTNGLGSQFKWAGPYANGQPFECGWSPHSGHVSDGKLTLQMTKKPFKDSSATGHHATYPYTAGQIISHDFYGAGCYSVCMKPPAISGVTASMYAIASPYDSPPDLGYTIPMRLEIDIEFVGKDTTSFQSNFFHTLDNRHANSASGNEKLHKLGFDAAKDFHAYAFVWSEESIKWYADGRLVRTAKASDSYIPNPKQSTMRIAANVWPVNKQAEEWAGPKPADLSYAQAEYKWIQFSENGHCQMTC